MARRSRRLRQLTAHLALDGPAERTQTLALGVSGPPATCSVAAPALLHAVRSAAQSSVSPNDAAAVPSLAVGVAHRGRVLWEEAFGWAVVGSTLATPHSLYSLASVSKPFTASALVRILFQPSSAPTLSLLRCWLSPTRSLPTGRRHRHRVTCRWRSSSVGWLSWTRRSTTTLIATPRSLLARPPARRPQCGESPTTRPGSRSTTTSTIRASLRGGCCHIAMRQSDAMRRRCTVRASAGSIAISASPFWTVLSAGLSRAQ